MAANEKLIPVATFNHGERYAGSQRDDGRKTIMAADKRSDSAVTTGTTCCWLYRLTQERNQVFETRPGLKINNRHGLDQHLLISADGPHQICETDFTCSDA